MIDRFAQCSPLHMLGALALIIAGVILGGCAPHLQVAHWEQPNGVQAVTIRCSAGGQTVAAELASDSTMTARKPTPEVP